MARWESEPCVTQSLIERLIDREPDASSEPPPTRAQSVRQLKASLRRDLEWLLNTRRTPQPAGAEYEQLEHSLYNYGVPDITSLNYESSLDRTRVAKAIETALAEFEPRVERIKVTLVEAAPGATSALRFQVEGLLMMDPAPEHISFDTVLQLSSGEYQVKGESSAG